MRLSVLSEAGVRLVTRSKTVSRKEAKTPREDKAKRQEGLAFPGVTVPSHDAIEPIDQCVAEEIEQQVAFGGRCCTGNPDVAWDRAILCFPSSITWTKWVPRFDRRTG